ncbi:MAG: restriction endonuclease subunit S [Treponema sp.]|nr:restriction endonuclease subunit S [Spirochaetales bacterium]MDY5812109.1 restriction endonuclease subunit S [Treponema sp.]
MNKLEELIKELCPDGVEYRKLGEIATVARGGNFQKSDFVEKGKPCIHYGQMYTHFDNYTDTVLTYLSEEVFNKSKKAQPNDIVMAVTSENVEDVCSCVAWLGNQEIAISGHTAIIHHNQNAKYMSYFFHSDYFFKQKVKLAHGTKVIEVTPDRLLAIEIPVPPLEVQKEIVRILDSFTELEKELEKELAARKKQYEYYRDSLLTFDDSVEWKTIKELFDTRNGYTPSTSNSAFWDNGTIPWFVMDDIRTNGRVLSDSKQHITPAAVKGSRLFKKNSIIVATSATIGEHALITTDFLSNQRFTCLSPKEEFESKIDMKFIFYYSFILDDFCKNNTTVSSFASVDMRKFYDFKFPLPPLAEQERIVSILDRFDSLCNSLTSGLPAEIEARRRQYQYYRDKLLSFKRC